MRERLSFYIERKSLVHKLNPLTKLLVVFSLIIIAFTMPFLWLPTVLFIFVLLPLSYIGKVFREYINAVGRLLLPVVGFIFLMQAFFYPGGETEIFSIWIFTVTLESLQFAFLTATRILVMVSSFLILLLTTHPSDLMSDLTRRGLPGTLSYVITSTLQIIPRFQGKAQVILDAQQSRGLETQGSIMHRLRMLLPLVAPLILGSIVDVEERAIALEARAFNRQGPKPSLLTLQDSRSQAAARWGLLAGILLLILLRLLNLYSL